MARAFARRSALLLLDEATASLDARAEYELFVRARELAQGHYAVLYGLHQHQMGSVQDQEDAVRANPSCDLDGALMGSPR